jgi:hypothetical protein
MTRQRIFKINQPFVVSELIDGEAVIMNLKSGNYYSARHSGALLWDWIEKGVSQDEMPAGLARVYAGDPVEMERDVTAFIDSLLEQQLISETTADSGTPPLPVVHGDGSTPLLPYVAPVLEIYADMQDLLLLDPIHDIDEVGWPVAKSTRPTSP